MAFENFDRLGKSPDEPYFGKGKKNDLRKESARDRLRSAGMFMVMLLIGMLYAPLNCFAQWLNRRRERKDKKP